MGIEDGKNGFPSYPVAKTGDWGLAIKVKPNDPANPLRMRGAGTRVYYAPVSISRIEIGISLISMKEQRVPRQSEAYKAQLRRHLDGTAPLPKLSAHTNVWGIGAIMFELLTHEAVVTYLVDDEWTVDEAFIDIPNVRNPRYSGALTELIRLCLEPEPWDRPSIEELELKIETKCQSILNEYAANPDIQERDRLYYKGSEINEMPPGNWNYWYPYLEYVPRPSEAPDPRRDPVNPFTARIKYPYFPTSELDGPEEDGTSDDDTDSDDDDEDQDDETPGGPKVNGARAPVVAGPSSSHGGKDIDHPLVLSSGNIGSDIDHPLVLSSGNIGSDVDHPLVLSSANSGSDVDHPHLISSSDSSDSSGRGNDAHHPLIIHDSNESDESHASEDQRSSQLGSADSVASEYQRSSETGSDNSEDSEDRRRRAIKKVPGT